MHWTHKEKMAGVALIEILFALAIFGVVLGAIYGIFESQQKAYDAQQQLIEMQQNARAVINKMVRELRMAGFHAGAPSFVDNLSSWVPPAFIPKTPMTLTLDANPKVTFGQGEQPDMITFLAVLDTSTNPTTLASDGRAGDTGITLNLNSRKTDQQYNRGDLVHIGLTSEHARVVKISGSTLTIDTNPDLAGNQGLARNRPAGTEVGEIMVVTYAVFNDRNDPSCRFHEEGRPVLKRKVNGGFYQPMGENITDLQITADAGEGRIRLFLTCQTEKEMTSHAGSGGHGSIVSTASVHLRNAACLQP